MNRPKFFNAKYQRTLKPDCWTKNEELNVQLVERAGYVPIQNRVNALIGAGERLRNLRILNNPNGDEEIERFFVRISTLRNMLKTLQSFQKPLAVFLL